MYIRAAGVAVVLSALSLAGCGLNAWKEDYRGVDLLTNRGLGIADFAESYAPGASPSFTDYVNFEELTDPADYGDTTGLPASPGPVYRLELVNLLPNGDFEATPVDGSTPAGWQLGGTATMEADDTAGLAISGRSALYSVIGDNAAFFDLRAGLLDGLEYPGTYFVRLLLRREDLETRVNFDYGNSSISFLALDGISWQSDPDPDATEVKVEEFPNDSNNNVVTVFSVKDDVVQRFYLGGPPDPAVQVFGQSVRADNITIGRVDVLPQVSISLPVVEAGSLELLPGRYRFSVYVKSEMDAQVTPATGNSYKPGQFSIGINDDWNTTTVAEGGWSDTWVELSIDYVVQTQDITSGNPLTLRMSVTSDQRPEIGRILVAAPSLEFVVR